MQEKRIAVVGSRSFSNQEALDRVLRPRLPFTLITGGAAGADKLAEEWALAHHQRVEIFEAMWGDYGRSAGMVRNKLIVDNADEMIAFHDGTSPGTKHSIELAKKKGIPVEVHIFDERSQKVGCTVRFAGGARDSGADQLPLFPDF